MIIPIQLVKKLVKKKTFQIHIFMFKGEGAKYMETLSTEIVKTGLMKRLREFKPDLPDPIKVVITKWNSNENTLGSYSYQTVNSVQGGVGPRNLAKSIGDGRVLFAGEATNEKHYSTVHAWATASILFITRLSRWR